MIGLDFASDVGDLSRLRAADLPEKDRYCLAFATKMAKGDHVLIFVHHVAFALCRVTGEYEYVRTPGAVWFRHSRRVEDVWLYSDCFQGVKPRTITMRGALSPLYEPSKASYKLIEEWLEKMAKG
jgi:hypothetical protein